MLHDVGLKTVTPQWPTACTQLMQGHSALDVVLEVTTDDGSRIHQIWKGYFRDGRKLATGWCKKTIEHHGSQEPWCRTYSCHQEGSLYSQAANSMAPDALLNRIFCPSTAAPPCCFFMQRTVHSFQKKLPQHWVGFYGLSKNSKQKSQLDTTCIPSWELTYPLKKALLKMIFLFPRWDMLVPLRVSQKKVETRTSVPSPHGRCPPWPLPSASDPAGGVAAAATGAAGAVRALWAAAAATGRAAWQGRGGMGGAELCGTCREGSRLAVGEGDFVGFLWWMKKVEEVSIFRHFGVWLF